MPLPPTKYTSPVSATFRVFHPVSLMSPMGDILHLPPPHPQGHFTLLWASGRVTRQLRCQLPGRRTPRSFQQGLESQQRARLVYALPWLPPCDRLAVAVFHPSSRNLWQQVSRLYSPVHRSLTALPRVSGFPPSLAPSLVGFSRPCLYLYKQ